jgi:hypothetical protein
MLRSTLAFSMLVLAAGAAEAASYSAKLSRPTTNRFIARDVVWNCGADACLGATENGRPVVLCQSLAKQGGHVDAFLVDGRALPASELERCNALAKPAAAKALAAQ